MNNLKGMTFLHFSVPSSWQDSQLVCTVVFLSNSNKLVHELKKKAYIISMTLSTSEIEMATLATVLERFLRTLP